MEGAPPKRTVHAELQSTDRGAGRVGASTSSSPMLRPDLPKTGESSYFLSLPLHGAFFPQPLGKQPRWRSCAMIDARLLL